MAWQSVRQGQAHRPPVGQGAFGHDVRDELWLPAGALDGGGDSLPYAGNRQQGTFDLGRLDAMASDLEQEVLAGEVVEAAVVAEPTEVSSAVRRSGRLRDRSGRPHR